jgi:hypothetical protein
MSSLKNVSKPQSGIVISLPGDDKRKNVFVGENFLLAFGYSSDTGKIKLDKENFYQTISHLPLDSRGQKRKVRFLGPDVKNTKLELVHEIDRFSKKNRLSKNADYLIEEVRGSETSLNRLI